MWLRRPREKDFSTLASKTPAWLRFPKHKHVVTLFICFLHFSSSYGVTERVLEPVSCIFGPVCFIADVQSQSRSLFRILSRNKMVFVVVVDLFSKMSTSVFALLVQVPRFNPQAFCC